MIEEKTPTILYNHRGIVLECLHKPDEELVDFATNVTLGTPGRIRYFRKYAHQRLSKAENGWFLKLKVKGKVIGSLVILRESIYLKGQRVTGLYIRNFAINAPFRAQPDLRKKEESKVNADGLVKSFLKKIFEAPYQNLPGLSAVAPCVLYAYVEAGNIRSANIVEQMMMTKLGSFKTIIFSRFFPKVGTSMRLADEQKKKLIAEKLRSHYAHYDLVPNLFDNAEKETWYCESNGEITVALNVIYDAWKIVELPGVSGFLLKVANTLFPPFKKLMNPEHFEFLAIDQMYVKSGYESQLASALESICAIKKIHTAMLWLDENSAHYQQIKSKLKPGILQKISDSKPVSVYYKSHQVMENHEPRPIYINTDGVL